MPDVTSGGRVDARPGEDGELPPGKQNSDLGSTLYQRHWNTAEEEKETTASVTVKLWS